jgi:hypothetical protein
MIISLSELWTWRKLFEQASDHLGDDPLPACGASPLLVSEELELHAASFLQRFFFMSTGGNLDGYLGLTRKVS